MPVRSVEYPGGVETLLRSPKMIAQMRVRARKIKTRAIAISPVGKRSYVDAHGNQHPGHYKASWHYRSGLKDGKAWARVYNTAHYSAFLEWGTRYMRRHKVLARAVDSVRKG